MNRKFKIKLLVFIWIFNILQPIFATNPQNEQKTNVRINIPKLSEEGTYFISTKDQNIIRYRLIRQLQRGNFNISQVLDNELAQEFVSRIINKLKPNNNYQNYILADASFNASAYIGDIIITNLGVWERLDDVNSFAAILAHEIVHLENRHISRILAGISKNRWLSTIAKVAGIAAISQDSHAARALIISDQALQMRGLLSYSRQMEDEADRGAIALLLEGGFDLQGISDLMNIMRELDQIKNEDIAFLHTHPLTDDRIRKTDERIKNSIKNQKQNPKYLKLAQREYDLIRFVIGSKYFQKKVLKNTNENYQKIIGFDNLLINHIDLKKNKNINYQFLVDSDQLNKFTDLELAIICKHLILDQSIRIQFLDIARNIYPKSKILAKIQINEWISQNQGAIDQKLANEIINIISNFDKKSQNDFNKYLSLAHRALDGEINNLYADYFLAKSQLHTGNIDNSKLIITAIEKKITKSKFKIPQTLRWDINNLKSHLMQL